MQKFALSAALLFGTLLASTAPALAHEGDDGLSPAAKIYFQNQARCAQVLKTLPRVRSMSLLMTCMDHYFLHGEDDPEPGSFNAIIRIGYRVLELDPHHVDTYTNVAWLLYSKWSQWNEDPAQMPDGELKLDEAVALLDKGDRLNARSVEYLRGAAYALFAPARHYKPELFERVIAWFDRADRLLPRSDKRKVRVRLDIAHSYRFLGDLDKARDAYRAVLEIDPANEVARRYLSRLEN